ncbi:MAG: HEAT repeat domain-containing protein [Candidatus Aminicenantes bacterium]|nr:HEAT repeat domain-containing protein [Candidatus Aminicenantes bacterium]
MLYDEKALVTAAQEGKDDADIKIADLSALIVIDREQAVSRLVDIIEKSKDADLRKKAIFILGTNKVAGAIPVLAKAAKNDVDKGTRAAASSWLRWRNHRLHRAGSRPHS